MSQLTRQHALAEAILHSRDLFKRYLKGFNDSNRTKQAPNLPNHVAWTLGHLAMTLHRCAQKFDGDELPPGDFVTGDGTAGNCDSFDTESVCFGSRPVDDPRLYPTLERCVTIYDSAIERLARVLRESEDGKLDSMSKWTNTEVPLYSFASRMVFHNGTHCGQLADLRRALNMGSIFA